MSSQRFARAYAQALWKTQPDADAARRVRDQLASFAEGLTKVPALQRALEVASVPLEAKQRMAEEVARQLGLGDAARRFLALLVDKHRAAQLGAIVQAFDALLDEKSGVLRAVVSCAHPLDDQQRAALRLLLERRLRARVVMVEHVVPSLLAGFVVQVGSQRFDVSLRSQLDRLAANMADGQ